MSNNIKNRQVYRICTDEVEKTWDRINFLTNGASVDCLDGQTVEQKIGSIKGITSSDSVNTAGFLADATMVKNVKQQLTSQSGSSFQFSNINGVLGYSAGGADTFRPFNNFSLNPDGIQYKHIARPDEYSFFDAGDFYCQLAKNGNTYLGQNYSTGKIFLNEVGDQQFDHGLSLAINKLIITKVYSNRNMGTFILDWKNNKALTINQGSTSTEIITGTSSIITCAPKTEYYDNGYIPLSPPSGYEYITLMTEHIFTSTLLKMQLIVRIGNYTGYLVPTNLDDATEIKDYILENYNRESSDHGENFEYILKNTDTSYAADYIIMPLKK